MKFDDIYNSSLVQQIIKGTFGNKKTEVVNRPRSFVIKLIRESGNKVLRLIILPPKGYTANRIDEASSHPEARKAKVTIRGGIKPDKKGFSLLKNVVKLVYFTSRNIKTKQNEPYAKINSNDICKQSIKSSKENFFVVKENGEGFYHNIINLSDEWILLVLEKELRLQKNVNFRNKIRKLNKEQQKLFKKLIDAIQSEGDKIFKTNSQLVDTIIRIEINKITPLLIEALNINETGKHEPCTIYAMILKIGKKSPEMIMRYLKEAIKNKDAPDYYLKELILKLS